MSDPIRRTHETLCKWIGLGMRVSKQDVLNNRLLCEADLAEAQAQCVRAVPVIKKLVEERDEARSLCEQSLAKIKDLKAYVTRLESELGAFGLRDEDIKKLKGGS